MSNIWSLFEDYEKKYHSWLQDKNVQSWYHPNQIVKSYQGSGIDQGLLGQEQRTMHPSEGVISSRHGGAFGHSGLYDQSLEYAGGKIDQGIDQTKDYFRGEKVWTPDAPTNLSRTGVHSSTSMKHLDQGIEKFDDIVNWSTSKADNVYNKMFPHSKQNIKPDTKKRLIKENIKTDSKGIELTNKDALSVAKIAGVDLKDVAKKFQDKGGFEGLMSNPAFTLGLALMQSSAEGKSIGSGILDNFVKAAGISDHYKDRIQARKDRLEAKGEVIGPPSAAEMGVVERVLESKNFKTQFGIKALASKYLFGKDPEKQYHSTVSAIAAKVNAKSAEDAAKGKKVQITEDYVTSVINEMIDKGELEKGKGISEGFFSGSIFEMRPELKKMAEGGPVQAGQPYIVGEKGPEIVVPNQNATVLSNDDSQVMSMLLASNPQLQNISRARAEGILRSRFPDYFA